jgi:hypothetical protein
VKHAAGYRFLGLLRHCISWISNATTIAAKCAAILRDIIGVELCTD